METYTYKHTNVLRHQNLHTQDIGVRMFILNKCKSIKLVISFYIVSPW